MFQDRVFLPFATWNKDVNGFVHPFANGMVFRQKLLAENRGTRLPLHFFNQTSTVMEAI